MKPAPAAPSSPDIASTSEPLSKVTTRRRRWLSWMTSLFVIVAIVATGAALIGRQHPTTVKGSSSDDPDEMAEESRASVMTIRPKRDPSIQVQVKQLASVEAFYKAELRARASGRVRAVHKDLNDVCVKDEVLLEIDVPDLDREVAQKRSAIKQREQEVRVARAKLKDALAGKEVAETVIRQRQAEVLTAEATRDFRRKRLGRIRTLAMGGTVGPDVVEEWERDTQASEAAVQVAVVAVDRARADLKEAESKVEGALADIDLKEVTVEAAVNEMEKAREIADFARVTAPFDGVVTRRNIDPGSFVQNASTGQSETLITVSRTDLVTVVAKFPDNAAPFISRHTPANIEIDEVPGLNIAGRVTRYSPSIHNSDRTMTVEVDLFNEDAESYRNLVSRTVAAGLSALASRSSLELSTLRAVSRNTTQAHRKGPDDAIPARAAALNPEDHPHRLLPGMTGTMRLELGHFDDTHVLPSSAVFSRGGKPYILLVRDGVTKQVPVQVQVNDGKVAKLSLIIRRVDAGGRSRESLQELTGREEIVPTRQLELGDGQAVRTTLSSW